MLGDSFRRQTSLAQRYAAEHNLDLDDKLTFHDLGISAYRGANAEYGRLADFKEAVIAGLVPRGSYLLVEALDRLSRLTPRKAVRVLEDIIEMDIKVVTLNDQKVYTVQSLDEDPVNLLMAIIYFIRANEESMTKGRRLKAAWEGKRLKASTVPITAACPPWLTLDRELKSFIINEDKAEVVKQIFNRLIEGVGLESIARELNQKGVPPFRKGKMWYRSYVQKIRDNPAVIGTFTPHKDEYTSQGKRRIPLEPLLNYYPVILEQDVFSQVQAMVQTRSPSPKKGRDVQSILAGLATCPHCGGSMTRVTKGSSIKAGKPYLVCAAAKHGKACKYKGVRLEGIEDSMMGGLEGILAEPPLPDVKKDKERHNLNSELEALVDERAKILQAIAMKPLPSLLTRLEEIESYIQEAEAALSEIETDASATSYNIILKRVRALSAAIEDKNSTKSIINAYLRQLFNKVVIDYDTGYLEFEWKHGGESSMLYAWADTATPH
jgi:DNA invertase Pin-like site-specific DNA recombinase